MAKVRKTILVPGKHTSPDGLLESTAERNRAWVEKFQKCRAKGIKIPVCWGHQPGAYPGNETFLASRLNAGHIEDLSLGPNAEINAVLDCPGLELEDGKLVSLVKLDNGATVKTAISDVSPGIFKKYRDGQDEVHEDIIGHLALAPLPVQSGQNDFVLAMATSDQKIEVVYLATKTDDEANSLREAVQDAAGTDAEGATDGPPSNDSPFVPEPAPIDPNIERVQQLCMDLASVGCPLPPDTDVTNFVERFAIAFGVLKSQMAKDQQAAEAAKKTQPAQAPIREEQPPMPSMLMSTIHRIDADPLIKNLLADDIRREDVARRERIDKMTRRGLKGHIAEALRLSADEVGPDRVRLSTIIDHEGKRKKLQVDLFLDMLDAQLPLEQFQATYLSTLAPNDVSEVPTPMVEQTEQATETVPGVNFKVTPSQAKMIRQNAGLKT